MLREHDDALKTLKREARQAASLPEKLAIQKRIKQIETAREEAWRAYDEEARDVETAKEGLIDDVERAGSQSRSPWIVSSRSASP